MATFREQFIIPPLQKFEFKMNFLLRIKRTSDEAELNIESLNRPLDDLIHPRGIYQRFFEQRR